MRRAVPRRAARPARRADYSGLVAAAGWRRSRRTAARPRRRRRCCRRRRTDRRPARDEPRRRLARRGRRLGRRSLAHAARRRRDRRRPRRARSSSSGRRSSSTCSPTAASTRSRSSCRSSRWSRRPPGSCPLAVAAGTGPRRHRGRRSGSGSSSPSDARAGDPIVVGDQLGHGPLPAGRRVLGRRSSRSCRRSSPSTRPGSPGPRRASATPGIHGPRLRDVRHRADRARARRRSGRWARARDAPRRGHLGRRRRTAGPDRRLPGRRVRRLTRTEAVGCPPVHGTRGGGQFVSETPGTTRSRDGTPIAWFRSGTGPPIVLVHGATADHTAWRTVGPMLGAGHTLYAIDRRGRGASGDTEPYAIGREYEDVAAVVDAVAAAESVPVDVIGHSFGGRVGLGAALLTPNLRRLVVYEGAPAPDGRSFHGEGVMARLEARAAADDRDGLLADFLGNVVGMTPEELAAYRAASTWPARVSGRADGDPRDVGGGRRGGRARALRARSGSRSSRSSAARATRSSRDGTWALDRLLAERPGRRHRRARSTPPTTAIPRPSWPRSASSSTRHYHSTMPDATAPTTPTDRPARHREPAGRRSAVLAGPRGRDRRRERDRARRRQERAAPLPRLPDRPARRPRDVRRGRRPALDRRVAPRRRDAPRPGARAGPRRAPRAATRRPPDGRPADRGVGLGREPGGRLAADPGAGARADRLLAVGARRVRPDPAWPRPDRARPGRSTWPVASSTSSAAERPIRARPGRSTPTSSSGRSTGSTPRRSPPG